MALKNILYASPLVQPEGNYRPLSFSEVSNIIASNEAAAEVVRIAGGIEAFISKTQGGCLRPEYWIFYDQLPNVWPIPTPKIDPYFEQINTPSTDPDAISQARHNAGYSKADVEILTKLDVILGILRK